MRFLNDLKILAVPAVLLTILAMGGPLMAGDGVTDINIDPATGFTISTPGSYRVVNSVTMTAPVSAISVAGDDVTLDLGGHRLTGDGGAVDGIGANGALRLKVFNGEIVSFGGDGIEAGDQARIEDVKVVACAEWGIQVGENSQVLRCTTDGNNSAGGSGGISAGLSSIVKDCTASANNAPVGSSVGIQAGADSLIESCVAEGNESTDSFVAGIQIILEGGRIVNCTASNNKAFLTTWGIRVNDRGNISGCTSRGNVATTFYMYGIETGSGSVVENCTASDNIAQGDFPCYGIKTGTTSTIRGNACYNNDSDQTTGTTSAYGIYTAEGCTIVDNVCALQTEGPDIPGVAAGILAGARSTVIGNTCTGNGASNAGDTDQGSAYGIYASDGCQVRNNTCSNQTARGTNSNYTAAGIYVTGIGATVEGNTCSLNTSVGAGSLGAGIMINNMGVGVLVNGNHTSENDANGTARGIHFFSLSTGGYSMNNVIQESGGYLDTGGNNTQVAGERADIVAP